MKFIQKHEGFSNDDMLETISQFGFKPNSSIVIQVGDYGPAVYFEQAYEIITEDDFFITNNQEALLDSLDFEEAEENEMIDKTCLTTLDLMSFLIANKNKNIILPGNGEKVVEAVCCENLRELKKYIKHCAGYDAFEGENINFPVLVLNDTTHNYAFEGVKQ